MNSTSFNKEILVYFFMFWSNIHGLVLWKEDIAETLSNALCYLFSRVMISMHMFLGCRRKYTRRTKEFRKVRKENKKKTVFFLFSFPTFLNSFSPSCIFPSVFPFVVLFLPVSSYLTQNGKSNRPSCSCLFGKLI